MDILLVLIGFVVLVAGGELLVRGATQMARAFGMSPMLIGLTVVACGTSAPELAASLAAAVRGVPEVALGNVLGSNTGNIGLILGFVALLRPVVSTNDLFRRELPLMVFVMALPMALYWNGVQGRFESGLLVLLLVGYMIALIREARQDGAPSDEEADQDLPPEAPLWKAVLSVVVGIAALAGGAVVLIQGAVGIAAALGVPDRVVGLTLVALGTSLPELAASAVAAWRGHSAMILGNIIGSNIFNVLAILGITGLIKPIVVDAAAMQTDIIISVGFGLLILPFLALFKRIGRVSGGLLMFLYFAYIYSLFIRTG